MYPTDLKVTVLQFCLMNEIRVLTQKLICLGTYSCLRYNRKGFCSVHSILKNVFHSYYQYLIKHFNVQDFFTIATNLILERSCKEKKPLPVSLKCILVDLWQTETDSRNQKQKQSFRCAKSWRQHFKNILLRKKQSFNSDYLLLLSFISIIDFCKITFFCRKNIFLASINFCFL